MFLTLAKQSLAVSWRMLVGCAVMVFLLANLLVWGTSLVETDQWRQMLTDLVPEFIQQMFPVPLDFAASPTGRIAAGYEHPFILVLISLWAISRGADAISGRLSDGSLEMTLAQPAPRLTILLAHATVTLLGCAVIGASAWLGTATSIAIFTLEQPVAAAPFLAAAGNLAAVGVFLSGLTTLLGAWDCSRGRTVGLAVGFCASEAILEIVARQAPQYPWLAKTTFLSAYRPQQVIYKFQSDASEAWSALFDSYGVLIALGLVAFAAAAAIFNARDLPAPV